MSGKLCSEMVVNFDRNIQYKIEAKNSELKNVHGYKRAQSYGITNMEMQGAMAIFTVNLKRIIKLSTGVQ